MLYLVLLLVIAAFGLLVAALTTAVTLWAWVSVGISVVAAGLLVYDWWRNRRRVAATTAPRHAADPESDLPAGPHPEPGAEPAEEPTDAADLLVVADLDAEVRVVDEHPRYHLAECPWLPGRSTIGLPVAEARELGFTPCARCTPDTTLATRHRTRQ